MLYVLIGSSKPLSEINAIITPVSQLRKLRLREVKQRVWHHAVNN